MSAAVAIEAPSECVIALAYGREAISDKNLNAYIYDLLKPAPRQYQLNAVEAFEELQQRRFDPGVANKNLAKMVVDRSYTIQGHWHSRKWLIVQWEIAYAIWLRGEDWQRLEGQTVVLWPTLNHDGYRARNVLEDAKQKMKILNCSSALIIAAPPMRLRTRLLARKLKIESQIFRFGEGLEVFSPTSVQWQTRGEVRAYTWELLSAAHHLLNGWII